LEVKRLFKTAWAHNRQFPSKLFVPVGQFDIAFPARAERSGISIVTVAESELSAVTDEAKKGFKEHVQRAHVQ
jgi:hypothetical protein